MAFNYGQPGKRIKRIRCKMGLSRAGLAEPADVSVPYTGQIETAKNMSASISFYKYLKYQEYQMIIFAGKPKQ